MLTVASLSFFYNAESFMVWLTAGIQAPTDFAPSQRIQHQGWAHHGLHQCVCIEFRCELQKRTYHLRHFHPSIVVLHCRLHVFARGEKQVQHRRLVTCRVPPATIEGKDIPSLDFGHKRSNTFWGFFGQFLHLGTAQPPGVVVASKATTTDIVTYCFQPLVSFTTVAVHKQPPVLAVKTTDNISP